MLIGLVLTFLICGIFGINDYLWQGYLGILYVGLLISINIRKKAGLIPAILFFYITILTLVYMANSMYFLRGLDMLVVMGLEVLTIQSYLYAVMVILPFLFLKKEYLYHFAIAFFLLGVIDADICLLKWIFGSRPYHLMNNSAMDGAFIACTLPFCFALAHTKKDTFGFRYLKYFFFVAIPIFVCFLTKSSSGVLGVGVAISAYLWSKNKCTVKPAVLLIISGFSVIASGIGYGMQKNTLFDGSGRYTIWENTWKFWQTQHHHFSPPYIPALFGGGLGSFFMYGPTIQLQDALVAKAKGLDVFFWLHNDWGQILFETGWVGLILTIVVFLLALYKSRFMPAIFSSLATFGAISFIQMPLRHLIWATLAIFLVSWALSPPEEGRNDYTT